MANDSRWTGFFVVPAPAAVEIPDAAFERLSAFFEEYDWSLAEIDAPAEDRLTPAVIGPLFEKHVNRKEQGAYYTKDDVTSYLASRTIIPFLLEKIDPLPWHLLPPIPTDTSLTRPAATARTCVRSCAPAWSAR